MYLFKILSQNVLFRSPIGRLQVMHKYNIFYYKNILYIVATVFEHFQYTKSETIIIVAKKK